jgi:SAM-dependent methyltransferase
MADIGPLKVRIRRAGGRALRRVGLRSPLPTAPVVAAERWTPPTRRDAPLPEGWTEDDLRAAMRSFSVDGSAPGALDDYWYEAFWRFLHTWSLVRDEPGRLLELGANPYFLTWLLADFTDADLTLANFFGTTRGALVQPVRLTAKGELRTLELASTLFNMEEDVFPYDAGAFDTVIFGEILEHLLMHPLKALAEINRVLREGGRLVVTTPNVARLENVVRLASGANIYDPYSGFGPYGRHNREYTMADVVRLLAHAGFAVQQAFTADSNPHAADATRSSVFTLLEPELHHRADELGQYLFVVATKAGPPDVSLPRWLYRSWPDEQMATE